MHSAICLALHTLHLSCGGEKIADLSVAWTYSPLLRQEISNLMIMLQGAMTTDFARQSHSLHEVD